MAENERLCQKKIGGFDRKREVMPEKKEGSAEKERECQKKINGRV